MKKKGSNFVSAAMPLIAAGPPRLAATGQGTGELQGGLAYPVGVIQSFNIVPQGKVAGTMEITAPGRGRARHEEDGKKCSPSTPARRMA